MMKHYLFFTRNVLPQPRADLVQVANCANAAANLGYSTVLTSLSPAMRWWCPAEWVVPFCPQSADSTLTQFYNLHEKLRVAALPIPWALTRFNHKWTHPSTIVSKYYFPVYLRSQTQLVHTRDWNFVKAAIQNGIPAIYEHHHHEDKFFEPEVVQNPLFQIAVTVADTIREGMIQQGMLPEKVITLHNGFNQTFAARHPEAAANWRQQLLGEQNHLAVYSGGLNAFKGVDLLIQAAKDLPQVQFVFAGGSSEQVNSYRQLAIDLQVQNVKFLGYVLQEQLASLLQAADVLVHPHCAGEEASFTSPLKFFDYLASGTPIVATEISALQEFKAADVVAGWCEPDQPLQLAEAIQRVLMTHPRKAEGYCTSINFVQQFSWENRIKKILSYVDDALMPLLT